MTDKLVLGDDISIHLVGVNPVVRFAAEELARYLEKMTGMGYRIIVTNDRASEEGIYLGTVDDLHVQICEKSELDDVIVLKTMGSKLFITGSNPRSVLFATYRYLELLGAEWLWPGEDGEVLSKIEKARIDGFDLREKASYLHRGVCIEGAVSPEMVMDFIDWMAKRRMNEFFLQFKTSQYFYNRYYARRYNLLAKPLPEISIEDSMKVDARVIGELKKRGMIVERVGHGWTCEAIGIRGLGWDMEKYPIPEEKRELMALVDGKRGLFGDIAVNTELCYSNPLAFNALVDHVVQYAVDHPEVDILHFWLSDGMNNQCECQGCQRFSPSDWYAKLVNAISHRLGEMNCRTRIVFLCYTNTLWAPKQESVDDSYKNTVFMFAPISRCYLHPLNDTKCSSSRLLEPMSRNRIVPPRTNLEFIQLLKSWQKTLSLSSDSFLFDYHLWSRFGLDFLGGDVEKVLWNDLRELMNLGLNGLLSCQTLRSFYPTGIPMTILAETLWNNTTKIENLRERYLKSAFGDDASFVLNYLEKIYSFVDAERNYVHSDNIMDLGIEKIQELLEFVKGNHSPLEKMARDGRCMIYKRSSLYLLHHNKYVSFILEALVHNLKGENEKALKLIDEALNYLMSTEDEVFKVADVYIMCNVLKEISSRFQKIKSSCEI